GRPDHGGSRQVRLTPQRVERARAIVARYPVPRSALLPLLYLAQEQDGYVADDAMGHIAELLDLSAAEVLGTASFYTMFKREPVGRHLVSRSEERRVGKERRLGVPPEG